MLIDNISIMGWLHTMACILALIAGAFVLAGRKGTAAHRLWGWWYAGAMLVQAVSVMAVYRFDVRPGKIPQTGPHIFGMFHWMAVASFVAVALAIFAASRQKRLAWAHVHAQAMLASYYLLVGGLINELVVRITFLRNLVLALSPHAQNPAGTAMTGSAQAACMMLWLAMALWFVLKVNRDRRPQSRTIGYPMRYSGGLLVACAGVGILIGVVTGMMGSGVMGGMVVGFIAARRGRLAANARWGGPSTPQMRAMVTAVGLEMACFAVLGSSGFFTHASRLATWEVTLAVVGFHFLVMRFSHGPMMLVLAGAVLGWLGIGALLLHLPLPVLAAGDGLIKLGVGAWMAWPLLRPALKTDAGPDVGGGQTLLA